MENNNITQSYSPIVSFKPRLIEINENSYIQQQEFIERGNHFYDIYLITSNKKIFLGRFYKTEDIFEVKYNEGKIVICYIKYIEKEKCVNVVKVVSLYDIVDDITYSSSEKEALNIFDNSLNSNYLKNPDKLLCGDSELKSKKKIKKI